MNKKTESGFIALSSVLIIGAVIIILGVSIFFASLTDQSISTAYQSGQEAAFLADFCLKEGVFRLKENIDYMGDEDIKVNDATCSVSLVEDVDDNTKKVSSLGRAGDQPHFSRSSQLIRYVIESEESDWERGEYDENFLEIVGDSLKLKQFEEIVSLNEASEVSCKTVCQQEYGYECTDVGTNSEATNTSMWTAFQEDEEYSCIEQGGANCQSVMLNYSAELPDGCDGYIPDWTYCRCEPEEIEGERTSPEFDISGPYIVKDSRIFWQADERFEGTIKVEVRVFDGAGWREWQQVTNGASIPGFEANTSLSGVKIKTKTSFVGGPDFYPSLENIKIFIEIK